MHCLVVGGGAQIKVRKEISLSCCAFLSVHCESLLPSQCSIGLQVVVNLVPPLQPTKSMLHGTHRDLTCSIVLLPACRVYTKEVPHKQ